MPKRCVLYLRVSRSTEESVSIARQEAELRAMAKSEGWEVVAVFRDDGVSGRVERAEADRALDAIAQGDAEVLAVWEMSRWSRMGLGAVAKLVGVIRERGALFVAKKDGLRSDQPAFGILAAVIAEVSAMEAEGTRDRILSMRAHVLSATAREDQRWLGGSVPFGYRAVDREAGAGRALVIDPYEAEHVRASMRVLVAGGSITEVTRALNDAGVATPQSSARRARQAGKSTDGLDGGLWRVSTVRKLVQSPTLIGRTTRQVEVGQRSDGSPIISYAVVTDVQGMPIQRWEPVVDPGTFAAVQGKFATRGPNAARKASSWLSGVLFCDLCGSVLYASSRKDRTDAFRCSNRAVPGHSCPGVSVSRITAEDYMDATILRMVGHLPELTVVETVEGADGGELDDVAQAINDVQTALAQDTADYGQLLPRLDLLKERRRVLLATPGRVVRTSTPTGRTFADAWNEAGIAERQFLVGDMLDSVRVLKPKDHGRQSKIEDRLEPVWVEHPVEDD